MSYNISNQQFLQAIFGESYIWSHVTSFVEDPNQIPNDRKGICWAGNYYNRQALLPFSNQFFCISTFAEEEGRSRRRKKNFSATYVIGVDDVREKIHPARVNQMVPPSIAMLTSKYSEQWFFILEVPETDRHRVDNLLDGLVAKGLAPDGVDPGMKGVTRYLRLPEGYNTKAKRIKENSGIPFKCDVTVWEPSRRYTLEQLAETFDIDLNAPRPAERVTGATEVPDHPVIKLLNVKSTLSAGRYDITCPWVDDHTDADDSGSAVFTNDDGTVGFQCHHGHCQDRTAGDLLEHLEHTHPGFKAKYQSWRNARSIQAFDAVVPAMSFMSNVVEQSAIEEMVDYQSLMNHIRQAMPGTSEQLTHTENFLKVLDPLPHGEQLHWYEQIQQLMGWSKTTLTKVVADYRKTWYVQDAAKNSPMYDDVVFISSLNQIYSKKKRIFLSIEAFRNTYVRYDAEVIKNILEHAKSQSVDKIDYRPGKPEIYTERHVTYLNGWDGLIDYGRPGEVGMWLEHFNTIGWSMYQLTIMQFMKFTIERPEEKINWALVLGGAEGTGKDFLLYPLIKAMGQHANVVHGESLLDNFNEYLLHKKYIHFNEVELGDHLDANRITSKLKPIVTAPPDTIPLNIKGLRRMDVHNGFNVSISTNSYRPITITDDSRRFFMLWTELRTRPKGQRRMSQAWVDYWTLHWRWMLDEEDGGQGGWRACVHHLLNSVTLEGFEPKTAPPVTDYMDDLITMSLTPLQEQIERMIAERIGLCGCDLITPADLVTAIKFDAGNTFPRISTSSVGRALADLGYRAMKLIVNDKRMTLYVIRDADRYAEMDHDKVLQFYQIQHNTFALPSNVVSFR